MSPDGAPVIVLAEDDPGVAALVGETLRADIGAEVIVVENGALVVDAVIAKPFDLDELVRRARKLLDGGVPG